MVDHALDITTRAIFTAVSVFVAAVVVGTLGYARPEAWVLVTALVVPTFYLHLARDPIIRQTITMALMMVVVSVITALRLASCL